LVFVLRVERWCRKSFYDDTKAIAAEALGRSVARAS
jgi:hypothetical protein